MDVISIETRRLRFRRLTMDDLEAMHAMWNDAGVRRYLWDDKEVPRETVEAVLAESTESFNRRGFGFWGLATREADELVGFCGMRFFSSPARVEILYGLLPDYWNRGLATEAALAMLRYGFDELHLDRIYAGADPPNAASLRVMEKSGMRFSERMMINGLEAIYYVISREDFTAIHDQSRPAS
jgi:ribosomal-protein-alanine N-acetyltransferase